MDRSFEVVIAGLGITGAATALELADRGVRVLAVDRHHPPHRFGSSHGATRVIREAYFEHPLYVPLVRRAFDGWTRIERRAGVTLAHRTGALTLGLPDSRVVRGTLDSATAWDIPHETLTAREVRQRFPWLDPPDVCVGLLEHRAGFLRAERGLETLIDLAADQGAQIRLDAPLESVRKDGRGLVCRIAGDEVECGRLVIAAGAWTPKLLRDNGLAAPPGIEVERQVIAFFDGAAGNHDIASGPILLWEDEPDRMFYTLPDGRGGLKAGVHHGGTPFDADEPDRPVSDADIARITDLLKRIVPGAGPAREAEMCLYTNMPDGHFLIDAHLDEPRVIVASACSGHGFKFAPALGPLIADLALNHPPGPEAAPFRWRGADAG